MSSRLVPSALVALAAGVAILAGLVAFSRPPERPRPDAGTGLDFAAAIATDLSTLPDRQDYRARDATVLSYRRYAAANGSAARTIILVHGSGWHGMQFHALAKALAANGLGTVIVPDLRGHGPDPVRRGDVDHIGQLEEDLFDLIAHLKNGGEPGRLVLGGHSSGGGLVVRFAGGRYGGEADAFLLLAPFLKYDAPTTRPASGGWARPATGRIVALGLINTLGITAFNHLPVISFAMPRSVLDGPLGNTATTRYTYRMNVSFAPRPDYTGDLARLDRPFLLLAGDRDEAFIADKYESTIGPHTSSGSYRILAGVNHLGLVDAEATVNAIDAWLTERVPAGS